MINCQKRAIEKEFGKKRVIGKFFGISFLPVGLHELFNAQEMRKTCLKTVMFCNVFMSRIGEIMSPPDSVLPWRFLPRAPSHIEGERTEG